MPKYYILNAFCICETATLVHSTGNFTVRQLYYRIFNFYKQWFGKRQGAENTDSCT